MTNPDDLLALALLAQLVRLAPHGDAETAARVEIRSADGEYIDGIRLPANVTQALTEAMRSLGDLAELPAAPTGTDDTDPGRIPAYDPPPVTPSDAYDSHTIAVVTDVFDAIDPWEHLDAVMASADPEVALTLFEHATGDLDGEL